MEDGPWGSGGSREGRRGLQVPDFVTSSLSRFHVFEHFIKTPKPSHGFLLVVPVLGRASFSELLSDASLFLAGKEERREEGVVKRPHLGAASFT